MAGGDPWSEEERMKLKELYPTAPMAEIQAAFPNRSLQGIWHMAHRSGLRRSAYGNKPGLCPLDGEPATPSHSLLQANQELLEALRFLDDVLDTDEAQGAVLHALDELEQLAEGLSIKGFQHPDAPETPEA